MIKIVNVLLFHSRITLVKIIQIIENSDQLIFKMDFEPNVPFFIDQEHEFIKKIKDIIKDQGVSCCRNGMSREYISSCLKDFNYGYVILDVKNSKSQGKSAKYILKGFTLFFYNKFGSTITDRITCGLDEDDEKQLFEYTLKFIKENNVHIWTAYIQPFSSLIMHYEIYGFKQNKMIYMNGKKRACEMRREFTYDNDNRKERQL